MDRQLFNLKFVAKQFARNAKKAEKQEVKEKKKLKKAIEKGNLEGARIYGQNAIRQKNQALNFLRLSSRMDAVCSRLESAVRMQQVTRSMGSIVKQMDKAMKNMNLEQISMVMDRFEEQFEDLDVQSDYIENAMGTSTSMSAPVDEVDNLINQVADEHGLEIDTQLDGVSVATTSTADAATDEDDELAERLAKLRAQS